MGGLCLKLLAFALRPAKPSSASQGCSQSLIFHTPIVSSNVSLSSIPLQSL